jgi:hydroxypyruvate isomerase
MIVMAGDLVPRLSRQAQHDSCVDALRGAADLAEAQGATVLLENVDLEENPDYLAQSMDDAFRIIADVEHPCLKLCYDLYHAQISGGNLIANLERHIDLVGKIHVGDVPGHHEPGTGEINFTNVYKKLAELGYDGYVAMEFLPTGDPVTTLAAAREAALLAASG